MTSRAGARGSVRGVGAGRVRNGVGGARGGAGLRAGRTGLRAGGSWIEGRPG